VKTAAEVIRRHEQHLAAQLHKQVTVNTDAGAITVTLDIVPDDDHPHAVLSAHDDAGEPLGRRQVSPAFKLDRQSASRWIDSGYAPLR
jgi:hypothetical protein